MNNSGNNKNKIEENVNNKIIFDNQNNQMQQDKKMTTRNTTDMNDNFFAAAKILNVLWKRKYHLIVLTMIGIIAGAVFSGPYFITPRYKSQATLYPSNISSYSEESETEQYMQWLSSQDIKDSIINMFDLYNHYGISIDDPHHYSDMMFEYGKQIRYEQTVYDAVTITVIDKDPKVACDIVNTIVKLTDNKISRIQAQKFLEVIPNVEIAMSIINSSMDSVTRKLEGSKSNKSGMDLLADPEYISALMEFSTVNDMSVKIQQEYINALRNAARDFTYSNIVSAPFVADKKSLPIRWVIVLVSGLGLLFLSFLGFLITENVPEKK